MGEAQATPRGARGAAAPTIGGWQPCSGARAAGGTVRLNPGGSAGGGADQDGASTTLGAPMGHQVSLACCLDERLAVGAANIGDLLRCPWPGATGGSGGPAAGHLATLTSRSRGRPVDGADRPRGTAVPQGGAARPRRPPGWQVRHPATHRPARHPHPAHGRATRSISAGAGGVLQAAGGGSAGPQSADGRGRGRTPRPAHPWGGGRPRRERA